MKIKIMLAGLFLAVSATSAFAVVPYVGVAGGVSLIHDSDLDISGLPTITASYDTGFGFDVSGGVKFAGGRVEGEFGYKKADIDELSGPGGSVSVNGADLTVMSYMINGYIENPKESNINPYLGAGLGLINGELEVPGGKGDDTVVGYQLMVGVGSKLSKNVTLDISYRFQGAADEFNVDGADITYHSSNIYAGIRFNFGGSN